jgi:hypothetical protein
MEKVKLGFAIRLVNKELPEDAALPAKLFEHNQAAFDYFCSVQEAADKHMNGGESLLFPGTPRQTPSNTFPAVSTEPNPGVKPFIKKAIGRSYFVVPIISALLFPQFKGKKSPGVIRSKGQKGMCLCSAPPYQISSSDGLLLQGVCR